MLPRFKMKDFTLAENHSFGHVLMTIREQFTVKTHLLEIIIQQSLCNSGHHYFNHMVRTFCQSPFMLSFITADKTSSLSYDWSTQTDSSRSVKFHSPARIGVLNSGSGEKNTC